MQIANELPPKVVTRPFHVDRIIEKPKWIDDVHVREVVVENVKIEYEIETKKVRVEKPVIKRVDVPVPYTVNKIVEVADF